MTYDAIKIVVNDPKDHYPWPYSAFGYRRMEGELVEVATGDGDSPEEAQEELS